jgi:hypothetical protein
MKLWEILVPTVSNAGKPFRLKYHRVWDAKVRAITGGLTVCPVARGQWVSPDNELFLERMIPVRVACGEADIERIADMTAAYYGQLAVMYYLVSEKVVVKHYGSVAQGLPRGVRPAAEHAGAGGPA